MICVIRPLENPLGSRTFILNTPLSLPNFYIRLDISSPLCITKLAISLYNLVISLQDFATIGYHRNVHNSSRGFVSPEGDQS